MSHVTRADEVRQYGASWKINDFKRILQTSHSRLCINHIYIYIYIYICIYIYIYIYYVYICIWCFKVRFSAKERQAAVIHALARHKCVAVCCSVFWCVAARVAMISAEERQRSSTQTLTRRLSENLTHAHVHTYTHTHTHTHKHTHVHTHTHTRTRE